MNTILRTAVFLGFPILALTSSFASELNTNQTSELKYGVITNGVRGELELISFQGRLMELVVWVNHVADTNFATPSRAFYNKVMKLDWDYWMPTNTFCGPIELRDSLGRTLPSRKLNADILAAYSGQEFPLDPEVSSLTSYPITYNLKTEHGRYMSRFEHGYLGAGIFPFPLFFTATRSELVRFQLGGKESHPVATLNQRWFSLVDFFEIKAPGEYQLTVWPKIYKRSATNGDLCERIDIPPVSVTIRWDGQASSSK